MEYNFKSFPSTEQKRQWGYIIYDPETKDIREAYCTCADYHFRLRAPYVRAKIGPQRGKLPPKYKNTRARKWAWNGEWTKKTNPQGKIFTCKHLAAAIIGYY